MKHLETSPNANRPSRTSNLVAATKHIEQMLGKLMESSLDATPHQWDEVIDGPPAATTLLSQPANPDPNAQPPETQVAPPERN